MIVKEAVQLFISELAANYPESEIHAITRLVFEHIFSEQRFSVILNSSKTIPPVSEPQIYNILEQLKRNKPIQYVLGKTEFYGLLFEVDDNVLIPRNETEELVEWILKDYGKSQEMNIIDIGTGSGCIAITLAKHLKNSKVTALDISIGALRVAQKNALLNNVNIELREIDILNHSAIFLYQFDIIVSNPPYVDENQKAEMHPNVLNYEPHLALFTGTKDPLIFYRKIAELAQILLKPGGAIYFEINETLADETLFVVQKNGFKTELRKDINNKYRMLKALKNG